MRPALAIVGPAKSLYIMRGTTRLAGPIAGHSNAIAALPGIERRLTPITARPCLCCGARFNSTGKGHRLCTPCRKAE